MNMRLFSLKMENFKGIKNFGIKLDGNNAVVTAANGIGKTTIYDAFLWVLFGKDSTGRKDFELRPLDGESNPVKNLILAVEVVIEIDGVVHTLRKEHHEKVTKGVLNGYNALCWIDEVPKKVGEFGRYITEIVAEDTFKLLTDVHFFNDKMHWSDRREVLLAIAGEIKVPDGFDDLIAALNGRTVDEYKLVLAEQKKRHTKDRDQITPRIDEIKRGMEVLSGVDQVILGVNRDVIKASIVEIDSRRSVVFKEEESRQAMIEHINGLKTKLAGRQLAMASDTTAITKLLEQKASFQLLIPEREKAVEVSQNDAKAKESELSAKQSELNNYTAQLESIRAENIALTDSKSEQNCYACNQPLPTEKLTEIEDKRKGQLAGIVIRGNAAKVAVIKCKAELAEITNQVNEANKTLEKNLGKLKGVQNSTPTAIAGIDKKIADRPAPDYTADEQWQSITTDIETAQKEIGDPVSEQLQSIDAERSAKTGELEIVNSSLSQSDRLNKDVTRIAELEAKEKDLAQKIASVEKELNDISEYKASESKSVELAVNGKFKHVEFKLFNTQINGLIDNNRCEATLAGVPYGGMSYGQKIIVGTDIINVLSKHNKLNVPLFIDNSESLTLLLKFNSQTIKLNAKKGVKKLTVKVEESGKV